MKFEPRLPRDDVNVTPRHPLKEGVVLVVGVVVVVTVLLGLATFLVDRLVPYLPQSWEASIFPDFGAMRHTPTNEVEKAQERELEALLEKLLVHWPKQPDGLRVGLLESSQPNARAFPGGLILVTTGLSDQVESENERVSEQYFDVETQNTNLANLYVASYSLHGSLDRETVINSIRHKRSLLGL